MNSQCPPCSRLAEAAQSSPEQNSRADPCPSQAVCPSCPCDPPRVPPGASSPSLPAEIPGSGEGPVTIETPGMCVMKFPLQKSILAVELCPPDSLGTFPLPREELCATGTSLENLEKLSQELPELCTLEVLELGPGEAQGAILGDPCASQGGIPADPCSSQSQGFGDAGDAKDSRAQTSPRAPFRLDSCTSSIVERCLSRCQGWFRGKN